jgi:hypothetical protein
MRILESTSILYNLPKEFQLKEFLIFDAVRFSLEIIDDSFEKLVAELEKASDTNKRNVSNSFHYAWTNFRGKIKKRF